MNDFRPWEMCLMLVVIGSTMFCAGVLIGEAQAESHHVYSPRFGNRACVQIDEAIFCKEYANGR